MFKTVFSVILKTPFAYPKTRTHFLLKLNIN